MQRRRTLELVQALAEGETLGIVVAEQQGAFQVEAFGLWTVQMPVEIGAGQVVGNAGRTELQDPLGVLQRCQVILGMQMQLAQVAGEPLDQFALAAGTQVGGVQLCARAILAG